MLVDDQIQLKQGEERGAINVLAKKLNNSDLKEGISFVSSFNGKLIEALNKSKDESKVERPKEVINQADLLAGIQKDMGYER